MELNNLRTRYTVSVPMFESVKLFFQETSNLGRNVKFGHISRNLLPPCHQVVFPGVELLLGNLLSRQLFLLFSE
jgi:hypothetical protein